MLNRGFLFQMGSYVDWRQVIPSTRRTYLEPVTIKENTGN